MIISNFIDESERHTELFFDFSIRQIFILRMVKVFNNQRINETLKHYYLCRFITNEELHWLERTGRIRKLSSTT